MGEESLSTERLRLVLGTPAETLAWVESLSPADRAEVSPAWLARVQAAREPDPWLLGFALVDRVTDAVVGSCGFKGPPDADGAVEIAYGIDPAYRRRGYATEAATGLVRFAFAAEQVRTIRAHTLPEKGASARVLEKCGFRCLGEVLDPEDGRVWRWERARD